MVHIVKMRWQRRNIWGDKRIVETCGRRAWHGLRGNAVLTDKEGVVRKVMRAWCVLVHSSLEGKVFQRGNHKECYKSKKEADRFRPRGDH